MLQSRRGDDEMGCENVCPTLRPSSNEKTPSEHDIFADRQHALIEHRTHFVGEPVIQLSPLRGIDDELNAEADFGERDGANEQ